MGNFLEMRKFLAPEFVFGVGALELAGQYASNLGASRALLVTDEGLRATSWASRVHDSLREWGVDAVYFDQVHPNPRAAEVMEGAEAFTAEECDAIVAVGGGSPMDCAKGIGVVSANGGHILEYEGVDQVRRPIPPLICVPTTAGSSADVSQFAIISDMQRLVKIAIISKAVVPDVALIDPETTTTMPGYLTACTGLDALTHAVEAYVSTANSPITDVHALEAVRLIGEGLGEVIEHPFDLERRCRIMLASLQAGLAFSNAILGAVHAMAHSLGGFLDLPHGECNAILLEHVVDFNFEAAPKRYRRIAGQLGLPVHRINDDQCRAVLVEGLKELRRSVGVVRTLRELGVKPENIPSLAEYAQADACLVTNPRTADCVLLESIYEKAL